MALTKTVNYTQNVPVDLGYNNEISGTTGRVTVVIDFETKAGSLNVPSSGIANSVVISQECGDLMNFKKWQVSGTEAEVNAVLNNLFWYPAVYEAYNEVQDSNSADRVYAEHKGEVLLETENNNALSVGDTFYLSLNPEPGAGLAYPYKAVAMENTKSQYRVYGMGLQIDIEDLEPYKYALISDGVARDFINDVSITNPNGRYELKINVSDDNGEYTNATTTLVGSLFVAEPYFTVDPPTFIDSVSSGWYPLNLGQVAQTDDELIEVQVLLKRLPADPLFDGDVTTNKPSYILDDSYGCFNTVRVGSRRSAYGTGPVRWSFYGTPAQCNAALNAVEIRVNSAREFIIETRIINSRSRIYYTRGTY